LRLSLIRRSVEIRRMLALMTLVTLMTVNAERKKLYADSASIAVWPGGKTPPSAYRLMPDFTGQ
jgi:hypothetical protein